MLAQNRPLIANIVQNVLAMVIASIGLYLFAALCKEESCSAGDFEFIVVLATVLSSILSIAWNGYLLYLKGNSTATGTVQNINFFVRSGLMLIALCAVSLNLERRLRGKRAETGQNTSHAPPRIIWGIIVVCICIIVGYLGYMLYLHRKISAGKSASQKGNASSTFGEVTAPLTAGV